MTFAKDSPLASRVVPAPDNWTRDGAKIEGITVHMAEGGGTVSWLTRLDGNSSTYVIEYDADIVQMVDEGRAAGSINPSLIRLTNDPIYSYLGEAIRYGRAAVLACMSRAAADNPNRYVIAIEVEGYAGKPPSNADARANDVGGPNAKQRVALAKLINDIRRRRGPLPVLGHRDFQSYKPCPGHHIPWADYGGHARVKPFVASTAPPPPVPEVEMPAFKAYATPKLVTVPTGAWIYVKADLSPDPSNIQISPGRDLPVAGALADGTLIVGYRDTTPTETQVPTYYFKGTPKDYPAADCSAVDAKLLAETARANAAEGRIANAKTALGCA